MPAEIRALLSERLKGRPTRANFRTGHLTICTLMPMRSVPHRVVCLLGLDDGVFPRKSPRDGDDLMLADPHVGDRDARTEDRQLLLDALLAATDQLIVTYTGNDERTNLVRPPAVPIGELLDVVDRTVRTDEGRASERVEVQHPLQPFDPKNFTVGELMPERAWSFDPVTLHGAEALTTERAQPRRSSPGRCRRGARSLVELDDLVRFAGHPVRAFLRQRLGISVGDYADEVEDALPVELDALERWGVGQRLLDGVLGGADIEAVHRGRDRARDAAPGKLGDARHRPHPPDRRAHRGRRATPSSGADGAAGLRRRQGRPHRRPHAERNRARRLRRRARGPSPTRASTPRHRLQAYVRWLALTAAHPDRAVRGGHRRAGRRARRTARRSRSPGSRRSATTRTTAASGRASSSRPSSTSTTAACASRSRSPA